MTIAYADKPVLWDNDIDIINNSITAIIGPNGAGKSTLIKGILNLQKKLSGNMEMSFQFRWLVQVTDIIKLRRKRLSIWDHINKENCKT